MINVSSIALTPMRLFLNKEAAIQRQGQDMVHWEFGSSARNGLKIETKRMLMEIDINMVLFMNKTRRILTYYFQSAADKRNRSRWLKGLWIANISLGIMFMLSLFVIDLNDCYLGMTAFESRAARFLWLCCGVLVSFSLIVCCRSRSFAAWTALVAYVLIGTLFLFLDFKKY